jgi:hypothetical protein
MLPSSNVFIYILIESNGHIKILGKRENKVEVVEFNK